MYDEPEVGRASAQLVTELRNEDVSLVAVAVVLGETVVVTSSEGMMAELELAEYAIEVEDKPGRAELISDCALDMLASRVAVTVTVPAASESLRITVEMTISVAGGSVVGAAVTVVVTSELCVTVRISVVVTGAAEEPPSTGTTEYCTALLWGICSCWGCWGARGSAWVTSAKEESAKMVEVDVRRIARVSK